MKQIIAIHGGDAYASYDEYIAGLKSVEIDDPTVPQGKGWKSLLSETLGSDYHIIHPRMPNSYNAKYLEWKIWFEEYVPYLHDGDILLGHSLGASFLAKYLSEERLPVRIAGTFLVAGPFSVDEDRQLVEFVPPPSLKLLEEQGGKVFLYHSKDDDVVDFGELAKYRAALPTAAVRELDGYGHGFGDSFPELIADIKSL